MGSTTKLPKIKLTDTSKEPSTNLDKEGESNKHRRVNSTLSESFKENKEVKLDKIAKMFNKEGENKKSLTNSFADPLKLLRTKDKKNGTAVSEGQKDSIKMIDVNNLKLECGIKNSIKGASFVENTDRTGNDDNLGVSDYEKQIINNQIIDTSQQRMKNYSNLFNLINTSIKELTDSFISINSNNKENSNYIVDHGKIVNNFRKITLNRGTKNQTTYNGG